MKRSLMLPVDRDSAYIALTDPMKLVGWLNIPYASTGHGELHLFEVEDLRAPQPWKVRGFIVENLRSERLVIEKDEIGDHEKPVLTLSLESEGEGCRLDFEWEDRNFDPLIAGFLKEDAVRRLQHLSTVGG